MGLSQNHYTTQRTDSVEQVIAHVGCIIETLLTALAKFPPPVAFEIGTSKNGVERTPDSLISALHSQVSTYVNMLYAFLFFLFVCLNRSCFVSWYFTFALWVMRCAFDCCGRRLVDVVQVHTAHMRCPGTRPHLKGESLNKMQSNIRSNLRQKTRACSSAPSM